MTTATRGALPLLAAPGSEVGRIAAKLEAIAIEASPPELLALPDYREALHRRCVELAMRRAAEPVQ